MDSFAAAQKRFDSRSGDFIWEFLEMGDPRVTGFNTRMVIHDLDDD